MQGGGQGGAKRYEWQGKWFRARDVGECPSPARAQSTYEAIGVLSRRGRTFLDLNVLRVKKSRKTWEIAPQPFKLRFVLGEKTENSSMIANTQESGRLGKT